MDGEAWDPGATAGQVAEVASRFPGAKCWRLGSGFLLPGGLVLTAGHLVPQEGGEVRVRSLAGAGTTAPGWLPCTVEFHGRRAADRETATRRAGEGEPPSDLAVLRCTDPSTGELSLVPAVRWGRLVTEPCRAVVSATGFPSGFTVREEDVVLFRDSAQVWGTVSGSGPMARSRYEVRVNSPVPTSLTEIPGNAKSRWKGMSGAAVLCDGLVVGVVASAAREPEAGRLYVQGLAPLWRMARLRGLLRLPDDGPEPAELHSLLHRHSGHALRSPVSLLRPEAAAVRFHGRDEELRDFARWRDSGAPAALRLLSAQGGEGKTRLALAVTGEASRAGWAAGFLADRSDIGRLDAFLRASSVPVLLVLDYAEFRTAQVREVVTALAGAAGRGARRPVRVLLLAREAGEWWSTVSEQARAAALVEPGPHGGVIRLSALEPSVRRRADAAREATEDLGRRLRELWGEAPALGVRAADQAAGPRPGLKAGAVGGPHGEDPNGDSASAGERDADAAAWRHDEAAAEDRAASAAGPFPHPTLPDVTDQRFEGALNLQMTVLVALLQERDAVRTERGEPDEMVLLRHEQRYWKQTSEAFGLDGLGWDDRRLLVACATLCGAGDARQAAATLARLPSGRIARLDRTAVASWLADLYPAQGRYWGSLQPDRVGEFLVGTVLGTEPRLLEWLLPTAPADQIEAAFHLLARTGPHQERVAGLLSEVVARHPAQLVLSAVRTVPEVAEPSTLIAALDTVHEAWRRDMDGGEEEFAAEVYEAVPFPTLSLDRWAADLAGLLVARSEAAARAGADDDREALARLASRKHRLAIRLGELSRTEQALAVLDDAVALRRRLAADGDPGHEGDLALSLNSRAAALARAGRAAEALETSREVAVLYERLAGQDPDTFLADLAMAETNLANQLGDAGRGPESVAPARSAVDRYGLLAARDRAYRADLALAHHNLSIALATAGRGTEALAAQRKAVSGYRPLAARFPDRYQPDLANALAGLAARLREEGKVGEARRRIREAVEIHRRIARRFSRPLDDLALALSYASDILRDDGDGPGAVAAAQEAVTLLRPLAAAEPLAQLPALASALNALGNAWAEEDRVEEAVIALEEAATAYRVCCGTLPAQRPGLADVLVNLAEHLTDLRRTAACLRVLDEAELLLKELEREGLVAEGDHGLADVLDLRAHTLLKGDAPQGPAGEAAVARLLAGYEGMYGSLPPVAPGEPQTHLAALVDRGGNWLRLLYGLGRWQEALAVADRQKGVYAAITGASHARDTALAEAARWRAYPLQELGRTAESRAALVEAAELHRRIPDDAADGPTLPMRLRVLTELTRARHNADERAGAAVTAGEAVRLCRTASSAEQLPPGTLAESVLLHAETLLRAGSKAALGAAREAVRRWRSLSGIDPDGRPVLCQALQVYADALGREGRKAESVRACEEAVRLCRDAAAVATRLGDSDAADGVAQDPGSGQETGRGTADPDSPTRGGAGQSGESASDLAAALVSLAWALTDNGKWARAARCAREAATLLGADAGTGADHGGAVPPDIERNAQLSAAFHVLSRAVAGQQRTADSLAFATRSVELARKSAAVAPDVYEPQLADYLGQYGLALAASGRHRDATAASEEAIALLRPRFAADPAAYAYDMAGQLILQGRILHAASATSVHSLIAGERLTEAMAIGRDHGWTALVRQADSWRAEISLIR
ncbi:serine protease [Streptomyces cyaneofuscatus]|uniref:serine protease n=1 Tax=Streptomyces cyaneofuscatus TaxID=66883 RepID=UPI0033ABC9AB